MKLATMNNSNILDDKEEYKIQIEEIKKYESIDKIEIQEGEDDQKLAIETNLVRKLEPVKKINQEHVDCLNTIFMLLINK